MSLKCERHLEVFRTETAKYYFFTLLSSLVWRFITCLVLLEQSRDNIAFWVCKKLGKHDKAQHLCVYVCICMYVWMDGWMDGCMYVCIYVCMYVCINVFIYVCTYVRMYVCMYV